MNIKNEVYLIQSTVVMAIGEINQAHLKNDPAMPSLIDDLSTVVEETIMKRILIAIQKERRKT